MAALALAAPSAARADEIWCTSKVTQVLQWQDGQLGFVGPNFSYLGDKSVYVCNAGTPVCAHYLTIVQSAMLSGNQARVKMDVPAGTTCTSLPAHPTIIYISLWPAPAP